MNKFIIPLTSMLIVSLLAGCGGSSSDTQPVVTPTTSPTPAPDIPDIPDTTAVDAVSTPQISVPDLIPVVTNAVLRHVHRNTLVGDIKPDGNFIDSPNGQVERLIGFGLYQEINRQANDQYFIQPEDNGLAYFRVINTKPNGAVRVHNFHGVPVGHYMTLDSTDVADDDSYDSKCRSIGVRLSNIPQAVASSAILQINGSVRNDAVFAAGRGYSKEVTICPVDQAQQYYLAIAVLEDSTDDNNILYGFAYYEALQDNDLIEIDIAYQADMLSWSADHPIDNEFTLAGLKQGWRSEIRLYNSKKQSSDNYFVPRFTELNLDTYRFDSNVTDLSVGVKLFSREFSPNQSQLDFIINDIELDDVSITPLDIRWNNVGQSQPTHVSGIVFDTDFKQTYAFMSMDPNVLSDEKFLLPLDNLDLSNALVALTSSAGTGNNKYIGNAALYSGYFYWPNNSSHGDENNANDSDIFITASISALLELLIEQKLEDNTAP